MPAGELDEADAGADLITVTAAPGGGGGVGVAAAIDGASSTRLVAWTVAAAPDDRAPLARHALRRGCAGGAASTLAAACARGRAAAVLACRARAARRWCS
ncbi:MAG: hypothetical protein H6709_22930 [Kofleriaceae bacterium]|nr:hypothetical protein [Kofleriaceae bacterium]